jgi:hypothetical protein
MTIQHRPPQFFEIYHKTSTNEFTSILTGLKYKNYRIISSPRHCRRWILPRLGSREVGGEVVSHPARRDVSLSAARHIHVG